MKRTKLIGLVGLIGLITVAAVNSKRMGIYLGLLQSDLDANGFAITNAVTFRGTNFVYEPSGVPILGDATNNDLRLGLSATNEALLIGSRATNNDTVTSNGMFAAAQAMTNAHGLHVDASNILSGGLITSAALTGRTMTNLSVKGNPSIAVQDDPGGKEVDIVYDTGIGANAGIILDSTSDPFDVAIKLNGTGIVAKAFSGNLNASQLASGTVPDARLVSKVLSDGVIKASTVNPTTQTVIQNSDNSINLQIDGDAEPGFIFNGGDVRVVGGTFTGSGAGLSSLNASALTSGTVASARFPYKIYRALLTQSGTAAPVATVLENTMGGTVVWARSSQGAYTATLSSAFTSGKTHILTGSDFAINANFTVIRTTRTSTSVITLEIYDIDISGPSSTTLDGLLASTSVQILVYP